MRRLGWGVLRLGFPVALAALVATPAVAGPPYVTDDPEPTDTGHWEIYNYTQATQMGRETLGESGFDINYGGAKDLQLTLVVPYEWDANGHSDRGGLGDIQLGAKYKFIHQDDKGWLPDVSVFPHLMLPTSNGFFGNGRASFFLPLWAEKDMGPWSTFGGGGYTWNPGPGNRNYWLFGWAVTRKVTDKLTLGGELYHQTADVAGQKDLTGMGLGFQYQMLQHWAVIGSGGPALQDQTDRRQGFGYLALEFTY
jgi:hypothetical protein